MLAIFAQEWPGASFWGTGQHDASAPVSRFVGGRTPGGFDFLSGGEVVIGAKDEPLSVGVDLAAAQVEGGLCSVAGQEPRAAGRVDAEKLVALVPALILRDKSQRGNPASIQ